MVVEQMYYLAGTCWGASFKIMDSPVEIPFKGFVHINRVADTAIYLQIANQLVHAIQRGILPPGTKMPGTRALGELLDVHRNTVVAVYDELFAQGWVDIKPNQGTFIISQLPEASGVPGSVNKSDYPAVAGYSFRKNNLLDSPFEYINCRYVFNDGTPDIRLTQVEDISRFYNANMKRKSNRKKMGYYNHEGSEYFKEQLSGYLNLSRGLHIGTSNLLITRSIEMSLFIISGTILSAGDTVLVGDPSYFSANMIFQHAGARITTVPVDKDGMDMQALRSLCSRQAVRMVYVTSHHHYPTTVSLPAQRRMELLQLASEHGFVIVEDDYDYDFHYDKAPLLPLASADHNGMVIYVGSFGKSLAPGFRTGFIVAPANLMKEMRKYLGIVDRQGDVLMEQALGEMIEDGVINRHLKKSLKVYRERRDYMALLLQQKLGEVLSFETPAGGLAFWTSWHASVNLVQLSAWCMRNDLFIPKILLYQNRNRSGMRIGFGHLNQEEMEAGIQIISQYLQSR